MRFSLRHLMLIVLIAALVVASEMYLMLWSIAQAALSILPWLIAYVILVALFGISLPKIVVPCLFHLHAVWLLRLLIGRIQAADLLNAYGCKLFEQGDYTAAVSALSTAIELNPAVAAYWENRGASRLANGDLVGAEQDFTESIALDGTQTRRFLRRGEVRFLRKDFPGCLKDFQDIDTTQAEYAELLWCRGVAHAALQQWAAAVNDYGTAYRLDPKLQDAGMALARIYAGCPDAYFRNGPKAIEIAAQLCQTFAWKDWKTVSILAAGYSEVGDFQQAIEYAQMALDLAPAEEKPERALRIEQYQSRVPFRIPIADASGSWASPKNETSAGRDV